MTQVVSDRVENFSKIANDFTKLQSPPRKSQLVFSSDSELDLCDVDENLIEEVKSFESLKRYIVKSVYNSGSTKKLILESLKTGSVSECTLSGVWVDNFTIIPGQIVNLLHQSKASLAPTLTSGHPKHISTMENILVLNPDHLISSTEISTAFFCLRKSYLGQKFSTYGEINESMLLGTLVHDFFQKSLLYTLDSEEGVFDLIKTLLKNPEYKKGCIAADVSEIELFHQTRPYVHNYLSWIHKKVKSSSKFPNLELLSSSENLSKVENFDIEDICSVESNIWSPRLGMKGRIDMIVDIKNKKGQHMPSIPLELKSGKASFSPSHLGQAMLYSLMMSETSDNQSSSVPSILLYLKSGEGKLVSPRHNEVRDMIIARNQLESYLIRYPDAIADSEVDNFEKIVSSMPETPRPINNYDLCSRCERKKSCGMLLGTYGPLVKNPSDHSINYLINEQTKHLNNSDLHYFAKWYRFLEMEEKEIQKNASQNYIWSDNIDERINQGICWPNLNIVPNDQNMNNIIKFQTDESYHPISFHCGDYVVISQQDSNVYAMDIGKIVSIDPSSIQISSTNEVMSKKYSKDKKYIIDYYEPQKIFRSNHRFLIDLFDNSEESQKLREIVVSGKSPTVSHILDENSVSQIKPFTKGLNQQQKLALIRALQCNDYLLINGYPGTGKTTAITSIVSSFVQLGKKVLISTLTNCALDHVLTKLQESGIEFIRFGKTQSLIDRKYLFDTVLCECTDSREVKARLESCQVFASTCFLASDQILRKMAFDVCIIDEASQLLQTSPLGSLKLAKKFILLGDENQLPPIVKSEAGKQMTHLSLFTDLNEKNHNFSSVKLVEQYRMNKNIMALANKLIYDDNLVCGSEKVALKTLDSIKSYKKEIASTSRPLWLDKCLSADLADSVIFLTYDRALAAKDLNLEEDFGIRNEIEAKYVQTITEHLYKSGLDSNDVAIISPYQAQVKCIRNMSPGSLVNTVDQFQGQDKPVVIISFCKSYSNPSQASAFFLESSILSELRRINVALTRAQCKLIMLGDPETLQYSGPISKVMKIIKDSGCGKFYELKPM